MDQYSLYGRLIKTLSIITLEYSGGPAQRHNLQPRAGSISIRDTFIHSNLSTE
jgi:hypothetical protein